jgi:hypothetical protein
VKREPEPEKRSKLKPHLQKPSQVVEIKEEDDPINVLREVEAAIIQGEGHKLKLDKLK